MQAIAGGTLRRLHRLGMRVATEHFLKSRRLRQDLPQQVRLNPKTAPTALNNGAKQVAASTQYWCSSNDPSRPVTPTSAGAALRMDAIKETIPEVGK